MAFLLANRNALPLVPDTAPAPAPAERPAPSIEVLDETSGNTAVPGLPPDAYRVTRSPIVNGHAVTPQLADLVLERCGGR
jgi:hypothetical protein